MKQFKLTPILLAFVVLLSSSCASILSGTSQKVEFKSATNATVYQNMKAIGRTNEKIKIKRKDLNKLYTIKADSCVEKHIELPLKYNMTNFINFPFMFVGIGLLGYYIDALGSAQVKTEKEIFIELECKKK